MKAYFKVKIINATPLQFAWGKELPFHANMIGKTILVRKTEHDGAYYECKTGESILKQDVIPVKDLSKFKIKGYEKQNLLVKPVKTPFNMFEVWCEVWKDGERRKDMDGYFIRKTIVPVEETV